MLSGTGHTRQDKAHVQHDWMSTWQTPGAEFPKSGKMAENSAEVSVYMDGHNSATLWLPVVRNTSCNVVQQRIIEVIIKLYPGRDQDMTWVFVH